MADAFSYNLVMLLGRVCVEPEKKDIGEDKFLVKFSMATNEIFYGGQKHVEYHPVVVFGEKKCQFLLDNLRKGMLVAVKGKLKHKVFTFRTGLKKTFTNVVADDVILLEKFSKREEEAPF